MGIRSERNKYCGDFLKIQEKISGEDVCVALEQLSKRAVYF